MDQAIKYKKFHKGLGLGPKILILILTIPIFAIVTQIIFRIFPLETEPNDLQALIRSAQIPRYV